MLNILINDKCININIFKKYILLIKVYIRMYIIIDYIIIKYI